MTQLVDTAEIAALLGVKRATVTNHITKAPNFPAPAINLSQRIRKWKADEVRAWLKSSRRSRPLSPGSTNAEAAGDHGAR